MFQQRPRLVVITRRRHDDVVNLACLERAEISLGQLRRKRDVDKYAYVRLAPNRRDKRVGLALPIGIFRGIGLHRFHSARRGSAVDYRRYDRRSLTACAAHGLALEEMRYLDCVGLAASAALTRVLASSLFGVSPVDPLTYASVSILLIAAASAATYIPALRAMRVDPMEALRSE